MRRFRLAMLVVIPLLVTMLLLMSSGPAWAEELASFFAYDPSFTGGVHVALCGPDSHGRFFVVTGPGPGMAPLVNIKLVTPPVPPGGFDSFSFFTYASEFPGGVEVACVVGQDDAIRIVTGAGPGGGPHVRVLRFPLSANIIPSHTASAPDPAENPGGPQLPPDGPEPCQTPGVHMAGCIYVQPCTGGCSPGLPGGQPCLPPGTRRPNCVYVDPH